MDIHSLAVAREYVAQAVTALENASAILAVGDTQYLSEDLANTASIASVDLKLVTAAWCGVTELAARS